MKIVGYASYFARRTSDNMIANPLLNMVTVGIVTVTVLLFASFALVVHDLDYLFTVWGKGVRVTAYLQPGLDERARGALQKLITSRPEVESVEVVSKDQALKRFQKMLKGSAPLVEDLARDNPLPESLEVDLAEDHRQYETLTAFAGWLGTQKYVAEVHYGQEWVQRFSAALDLLKMLGWVSGAVIVLASIFIISNTIKVTLYARKDELEIMKLVGATDLFIAAPFVLEGALQGLAGSALALAALFGGHRFALNRLGSVFALPDFPYLPHPWVLWVLGGGALVGALASLISSFQFLKEQS